MQTFSPRPNHNASVLADNDQGLMNTTSTFKARSSSIAVPFNSKIDRSRYNESTGLILETRAKNEKRTSTLEAGGLPQILSKGKGFLSPKNESNFRSSFFGS